MGLIKSQEHFLKKSESPGFEKGQSSSLGSRYLSRPFFFSLEILNQSGWNGAWYNGISCIPIIKDN